jgi:cell division protein FtsI/penicillin-binding protein 2
VREIHYQSGITKKIAYGDGKPILKPDTAMEISRMLVSVVDTKLANGKAKNPKYSVAAKTGTAQIANPEGGGYYEDRYLHSFFGYFPAYDPQFLVFFYTVHPRGVQFASETLTQPFLETSRFLINYYNIPPDR